MCLLSKARALQPVSISKTAGYFSFITEESQPMTQRDDFEIGKIRNLFFILTIFHSSIAILASISKLGQKWALHYIDFDFKGATHHVVVEAVSGRAETTSFKSMISLLCQYEYQMASFRHSQLTSRRESWALGRFQDVLSKSHQTMNQLKVTTCGRL